MKIAIDNSSGAVKAADLTKAVVALNHQLLDVAKFWNITATVQVGSVSTADVTIFLSKTLNNQGILGFHDILSSGRPYGLVYTALSQQLGEPWTVTLSHEVLEAVVDPEVNRYAVGDHPTIPGRTVFFWYESGDPVQAENYLQDSVAVSNFVLPLYFTPNNEPGTSTKNDFMRATGRKSGTLSSLGLSPGGYVGFYDPVLGQDDVVFADKRAEERHAIKQGIGAYRRAARYRSRVQGMASPAPAAPQRIGIAEALRYVKDVEVIVQRLQQATDAGLSDVDVSGLDLPSFAP